MKSVLFVLAAIATLTVAVSKKSNIVHETQDGLKYRIRRSPVDTSTSLFGDESKEDVPAGIPLDSNDTDLNKGFLPLPKGYNKLILPLGDGDQVSPFVFVIFHLLIREILDVDTKNGIIEIDTELGMTWIDWNVWRYYIKNEEAREQVAKSAFPNDYLNLDADFLKQIWKPDIFIEEMAGVEKTFLLTKLITLHFLVNNPIMPGAIDYKSRQTFKVRCDMEFGYFPADTQKCELHIRSYSHPNKEFFLIWNVNQPVFLDKIEDSNYDMQVSNVEPGETLYDYFTQFHSPCCNNRNFSTLKFTLQLRRSVKYHLIQTCLPSILLVFITWLCFLIPTSMVEARIGISMTTLLTLTAMFTAVREQSPQVSYTMAIDIWMVFCMLILFVALVLFTVIYWMRRKLERMRKENKGENQVENGDVSPSATGLDSDIETHKIFAYIVTNSKKTTFILFACVFIIFLLLFGSWIMLASGYLDWEPSAKYNAIELEDPDDHSNRLFTNPEKKFKPNAKTNSTNNDFRFRDVFKHVILPTLPKSGDKGSKTGNKNENNRQDGVTSSKVETTTKLAEIEKTNDPGETKINSTTIKPLNTTVRAE